MTTAPSHPEFSRPLALAHAGRGSGEHVVEASGPECAALAARLGIPAVLELTCRFTLARESDEVVRAEGALAARLVRECVVSLEPFEEVVAERFRLRFVPAERLHDADEKPLADPDADDDVPYDSAVIDLGEAAAEQLALAMAPWPRKPGAALPEAASEAAPSPFAAIARRRREPG